MDPRPASRIYSSLSIVEKWEWHADVYAFRRVYLGIYDTKSPPDPNGIWYNVDLVDAAERRKREGQGKHPPSSDNDREAWARSLGWASWLERQDAIARNEERYAKGLAWQRENAAALRAGAMARPATTAEALGVRSTEEPPAR
jgi:hypothetical protein